MSHSSAPPHASALGTRFEITYRSRAENQSAGLDSPDQLGNTKRKFSPAFSVTRRAISVLLDAKANAYQICTYLIIAQFTDKTGIYSNAGLNAVGKYLSASKAAGHPIDRALRSLKGETVLGMPQLTRLMTSREEWIEKGGKPLPDGPTDRRKVRHILERNSDDELVWISSALVLRAKNIDPSLTFDKPLTIIKSLGDIAARALLYLYQCDNILDWHGVAPHEALCRRFRKIREPVVLKDGGTLIREAIDELFVSPHMIKAVGKSLPEDESSDRMYKEVINAVSALNSAGFIYETVLVLDRARDLGENADSTVDTNASPLYALDTKSLHGYKPIHEEGLAGITAKLANKLYRPVTNENGSFDGVYAAFLPPAQQGMIVGIMRIRFRATNPKLPDVATAWIAIKNKNERAYLYLAELFSAYNMPHPRRPVDLAMEAASRHRK